MFESTVDHVDPGTVIVLESRCRSWSMLACTGWDGIDLPFNEPILITCVLTPPEPRACCLLRNGTVRWAFVHELRRAARSAHER